MKNKTSTVSAREFDKAFEAGGDITPLLDLTTTQRPGLEQRRINVDLPAWIIASLDNAARTVGVTRQSIIKIWLADRIKEERVGHGA